MSTIDGVRPDARRTTRRGADRWAGPPVRGTCCPVLLARRWRQQTMDLQPDGDDRTGAQPGGGAARYRRRGAGHRHRGQHHLRQRRGLPAAGDRPRHRASRRPDRADAAGAGGAARPATRRRRWPPSASTSWWYRPARSRGRAANWAPCSSSGTAPTSNSLTRQLDAVQMMSTVLRAQRHEFANRLHLLNGLLHTGHTEEASGYLEELLGLRAAGRRRCPASPPSVTRSCRRSWPPRPP